MTEDANPLDGLLAPLTGAGPAPDPAEHPSDGTLSAYAEGKLAEAEELEVQEHLAVCGRCRGLLLDFASFVEVPLAERVEGVADLAAAKEWRALQARMASSEARPMESSVETDYRLSRSLRVYQVLVAALGVLVVGLLVHSFSGGRGSETEVLPSSEPFYFTTDRSGPFPEPPVRVHLPCALSFSAAPDFSRYRVEIHSDDGRSMLTADIRFREGTIPLQEGKLSPGEYSVSLFGLGHGEAVSIGKPRKLIILP